MRTDYDTQARAFLKTHGIRFDVTFAGWVCPDWCQGDTEHPEREHMHGPRWAVTLDRTRPAQSAPDPLTFDFWSSYAGSHEPSRGHWLKGAGRLPNGGKRPRPYDVLACASSEIDCPETFADWCADYGYDADSIRARDTWERCAEFATRLRAFFATDAEREALAEIQ